MHQKGNGVGSLLLVFPRYTLCPATFPKWHGLASWVQHSAHEQDRSCLSVVNDEEEGAVDGEFDGFRRWPRTSSCYHHCSRRTGFGALLVETPLTS